MSSKQTPKEFAKRHEVSIQAVTKAVRSGRLAKSVNRDGRDRIWIDPVVGDLEWTGNATAPSGPPPPTALADRERWERARADLVEEQARLARVKALEADGELVPKADVLREWSGTWSRVQNRMLAIPTEVKLALPALTVADVVTITDLVRAALNDAADNRDAVAGDEKGGAQ